MAIRPCPNSTQCPDDVFGNLSVEEPDPIDYVSTQFASFPPPLLPKGPETWSATECGQTFVSTVSQLDADLQAAAAAILCNFHQENPGVNPIYNEPDGSKCCVLCPDGNQFCYTAPAIFAGLNLAQANAIAHQWACKLAAARKICLSELNPSSTCKGKKYTSDPIIATGAIGICTWTIEAGALPDGIFMGGVGDHIFTASNNQMTLSGTPTVVGDFNFTLRCTDTNGSFMQKVYSMTIKPCGLDSYWTFQESSGNRIDSVQGLAMVPSDLAPGHGTTQSTDGPAFIGNGIRLIGNGGTALASTFGTGDIAALKCTGQGFSVFGWFNITSAPANGSVIPMLTVLFNDVPSAVSLQIGSGYTSNAGIAAFQDALAQSGAINIGFSASAWNFFHLFYDSALKQFGFSINNGAPTLIGANVQFPANTIGSLSIGCGSIFGTGPDIQFDEVGMAMHGNLTAAQVAYLYNSGAGRTWPISLP